VKAPAIAVKATASFAAVARRMTAWTTNLLATAVVVLLALCVGRQLIVWYRIEPVVTGPAESVALANLGDGTEPLELEFGSLGYPLQRRVVRGSLEDATKALVAVCREHLLSAPLAQFGPAEGRLLELCQQLTPVIHDPGGAEIFSAPQGLPMVVATRPFLSEKSERPLAPQAAIEPALQPARAADAPAGQLGATPRRVVTWGLATPAGAEEWHLYVAHAAGDAASPAPVEIASKSAPGSTGTRLDDPQRAGEKQDALQRLVIPLPPGARRTLSVTDARGAGLSAIAGDGPASAWTAYYADWFRRRWKASGDWQYENGVWRARFERAGEAPMAKAGVGERRTIVDIEIMPDGVGGVAGFISVARANENGGK
jgi:hypothetical protein